MHSDTPSAPPDRTYAIGDIHGRSDLLDRLVEAISRDLKERPVAKALAVTSATTLIAGLTRAACLID